MLSEDDREWMKNTFATKGEVDVLRQETGRATTAITTARTDIGNWLQTERAFNGQALYMVKGEPSQYVLGCELDDDRNPVWYLVHVPAFMATHLRASGDVDPMPRVIDGPEEIAWFKKLPGYGVRLDK